MSVEKPQGVRKEVMKMYPEEMYKPMKEELTSKGFEELLTEKEVHDLVSKDEISLIAVNTVCGCAASSMRPAVLEAVKHSKTPKNLFTVFAGVDFKATDKIREYFNKAGYPPSSPALSLMKGEKVLFMMQREDINGRDPFDVKDDLVKAFEKYC